MNRVFRMFSGLWVLAWVFGLSLPAQASTKIQCPLSNAKRTITNELPDGWWTTPIVNKLTGTRIDQIGGKETLICEYGKSGSVQKRAPGGEKCKATKKGFQCGGAASSGKCAQRLQGKIAWNYDGNKNWADANMAKLCKGAKNSPEPALCFHRVMHKNVNWGGGTKWKWKNAITLCAGSKDATNTISCFKQGISVGKGWKEAAEFCSP